MKTFLKIAGLLFLLAMPGHAQSFSGITWFTNYYHVILTVDGSSRLNANGIQIPLAPPITNTTTLVFTNVVSMPFLLLTPYTVPASTNSTFGYGAGLVAMNTNYLYLSVSNNGWRRISIPTNTW